MSIFLPSQLTGLIEGQWTAIDEQIEADLLSSGVQVVHWPGCELTIVTSQSRFVTVEHGQEQIEKLTIDQLPCIPLVGSDTPCIAREIAARVLESKRVAAVMSKVPATPAGKQLSGKLAVLELRNFTRDLTPENARYFTDSVRRAALKRQPQLEIMTRENLLVLLESTGKKLEDCEGECEVDTGRRLGADEIVSGEIQKLGNLYKLSLRLHDTHAGRLLSSTQASGRTIEELDSNTREAAEELLAGH